MRVQQLPDNLLKAHHAVMDFLLRDVRRVAKAIAAWGNTYLALSGLGAKSADNLKPGRWPGLRYFAPLGLNLWPSGAESSPLWGSRNCMGMVSKPRPLTWVSNTANQPRALKGRKNPFQSHTYRSS